MVSDQQSFAARKNESFLYRVFKSESIRDLSQQHFTYLGAEIYFNEDGKTYRYDEPEFDFESFHAYVKDKYDNYHIEDFILITKEGQFNIRYFPLTEYSPKEHTELTDNIELVGFRMFPELLPIGANLLLSMFDKDLKLDIEGNIRKFEKLLKLIQGDKSSYLKIQLLMNLTNLYFSISDLKSAFKYVEMIEEDQLKQDKPRISLSRAIRNTFPVANYPGSNLLVYDVGSVYQWKFRLLYLLAQYDNIRTILNFEVAALQFWNELELNCIEDRYNSSMNIAQLLSSKIGDHEAAIKYYKQSIDLFSHLTHHTVFSSLQVSIAYFGIGDYLNAQLVLEKIDQGPLSIEEKFYYFTYLGKSYLVTSPEVAFKHLIHALELVKSSLTEFQDYIVYPTLDLLVYCAYLLMDTKERIDKIKAYLPQLDNNSEYYATITDTIELLLQVKYDSFDSLSDSLLAKIRRDSKDPKVDQYRIDRLVWVYLHGLFESGDRTNPEEILNNLHELIEISGSTGYEETRKVISKVLDCLEIGTEESYNRFITEFSKFIPQRNEVTSLYDVITDLVSILHSRMVIMTFVS